MENGADPAGSPPADPTAGQAPAPDAQAAPSAATDGAKPSGESSVNWREKLLGVVKSAAEQPPGVAPAPETTAKPGDTPGGEEPTIPEPFNKHPDWIRLAKKRDEWKGKAETAERAVAELRGAAEGMQKVETFLRSNGVSNEQAAEAIQYAALYHKDPRRFRDAIAQVLAAVDQEIGVALPPDLAQAVRDGGLSEQHALELSMSRQQARRATAQAQTVTTAAAQERASTQAMAHMSACASAVDRWAQDMRSRDPDFAGIESLVVDRVVKLAREAGLPPSPQDAVNLSTAALRQIKAELGRFRPAASTPPRPPAGGSATARPDPKNWKAAAYNAVGMQFPAA